MIWKHRDRMHWFSTDISPLIIEVKVLKTHTLWRVKSKAGTFFQGKADHPMDAMSIGTRHAQEVAKRYVEPAKDLTKSEITRQFAEDNGLEVQEIKISNDIKPEDFRGLPEDVTVLPGEPSSSDH